MDIQEPTSCSVDRLLASIEESRQTVSVNSMELLKAKVADRRRGQKDNVDPEWHSDHGLAFDWVEMMQGETRQRAFFTQEVAKRAAREGLLDREMVVIETPIVPTVKTGASRIADADRAHCIHGPVKTSVIYEEGVTPHGWLWKTPAVRARLKNGVRGHYTMHVRFKKTGMCKFLVEKVDSFPLTVVSPWQAFIKAEQIFGRTVKVITYNREV